MEKAGIFYGHLELFTVILYILWPFDNVVEIWYIFPCFGLLSQDKSGNPDWKGKRILVYNIEQRVRNPRFRIDIWMLRLFKYFRRKNWRKN
jgi:hypothetical protein